jgi:hypothetical protein
VSPKYANSSRISLLYRLKCCLKNSCMQARL